MKSRAFAGSPLACFFVAMNHTDREVEEVDRLVRNLTSASKPSSDSTVAGDGAQRSANRWTNVTVRMPSSRREPGVASRVGSRVSDEFEGVREDLERWFRQALAYVRNLRRFLKVPSAITLVRMWVA